MEAPAGATDSADRFIDTDQKDPRPTEVLFRSRPRPTTWQAHQLTVRMDLWCPGSINVLRYVWTDEKSRLGRKGTTPRVAALALLPFLTSPSRSTASRFGSSDIGSASCGRSKTSSITSRD